MDISLKKSKIFAFQILQCYLMKEGRIQKFSHCLYGKKDLAFENLKSLKRLGISQTDIEIFPMLRLLNPTMQRNQSMA